jgi:DNA-binding MarR family transcriptional regulator
MSLPLYYAILKLFLGSNEYDAEAVIFNLQQDYGKYKALTRPAVQESLMSAEKNGLLRESRITQNQQGELQVFYVVTDYGQDMIKRYIG